MRSNELLAGNPIFRDLSEDQLDRISAICEPSDAGAGDTLFSAGSAADAIYIIALGTVEMTLPAHEMRFARFGTGQILGVAAPLLGGKYGGNAVAVETTRLVKIPCAKLEALLDEDPALAARVYRNIAHYLAHHIVEMASERTTPYA
jgi:CRP-like cAMP-binding protein